MLEKVTHLFGSNLVRHRHSLQLSEQRDDHHRCYPGKEMAYMDGPQELLSKRVTYSAWRVPKSRSR